MIPSDIKLPFELKRRQFPVKLAFCFTINKAQGQTLRNAGVYLPEPVFSHGQLYVALSRVCSPNSIKIFTENNINRTKNVVFKEIFNN